MQLAHSWQSGIANCNAVFGRVKSAAGESVLDEVTLGVARKTDRAERLRFCLEALSIPAVMIIHRLLYNVSGYVLDNGTRDYGALLETPLDRLVPYVPVFILPYLMTWVLGLMVFAYVLAFRTYDRRVFRALYLAVLAGTLAEFTIWQIFPASISLRVPPEILAQHGWLGGLTQYAYDNATPWNVFPSAHISHAAIAWIFAGHFSRPEHRRAFFAVFVAICLCVVLVRNHYLVDIASGILVTILTYQLVFLPILRSERVQGITSAGWLAAVYGACGVVMLITYTIMGAAWSL